MGRPKKWPSYALEALEDIQLGLKDIEALSRLAQQQRLTGQHDELLITLGDIRVKAMQGTVTAIQAYTGQYEKGG